MSSSDSFDELPDWEALARYKAGESTADETAAIAQWLERNPEDARVVAMLEAAIADEVGEPATARAAVDVEGALTTIHGRMLAPEAASPQLEISRGITRPSAPKPRVVWALGSLAAAAAIAAITIGVLRGRQGPTTAESTTMVAVIHELKTAVGARDSVVLPDGTRVLLGPASHLTLAEGYNSGTREVALDGIARFSVRHDKRAPFTVHAGTGVIRDVGTEFVVRTGDSIGSTIVAVVEGEVSVAEQSSVTPTRLQAGDRGTVSATGAIDVQRGVATDDDTAWTRGALVYHAASLPMVREDLRRWYGIDLRVEDSALTSRRITATFDHQPVDKVVRDIALALGAEATRTGNVVTLRPLGRSR